MLLRGVNGPCIASGPYSCRYTDAHRMFRCLSGGSSGALLTKFQSRLDLVKLTPVTTPTVFSLHHRTFRCLGLAGPPVMFSLNPFAGPRVSLTPVSLPPRETAALHPRPYAAPPPPLLRRLSAAARAPLLHRFAAAPQTARPSHARAALLRACAACAPLTTRRRHPSPAPPPAEPARLLRAPCTSILL